MLDKTDEVRRAMAILREVPARRKRVCVLIGNEPIAACYERAQRALEWGSERFCQPFIPLNTLPKTAQVRYDWSPYLLTNFARYYNRRQDGPPAFAGRVA